MSLQQLLLGFGAPQSPVAGYRAWYRGDSYAVSVAGRWDDKSANLYHLTASANAPTLIAADANFANQPSVDFNGTNQYTGVGAAPVLSNLIANNAFTIFGVLRAEAFDTNNSSSGDWRGVVSDSGDQFGIGLGLTKLEARNDDGVADYTGNPVVSLNTVYGFDCRHDTGNLLLLVSGKTEASVASGNTAALTGVVSVGKNAASVFWDGQIAELIFYNTVLSAADRTTVRAYLTGRYGIVW